MMLNLSQLSELTGLKTRTHYKQRWRYQSSLPLSSSIYELCSLMVKVGRSVRIDEQDVRSWLRRWSGRKGRSNQRRTANDSDQLINTAETIRQLSILAADLDEDFPGEARHLRSVIQNLTDATPAAERNKVPENSIRF
jgi:hypothetical protein